MWVNGVRWEVTDRGYKSYLSVPNRIGGMCLTWNDVEWFYKWVSLNKCKSYLEIGVFDGILISLLAERVPKMLCYGIDPFQSAENTGGGHWEYFYTNNKDYENVHFYKDKSEIILPRLLDEGCEFDLIFVDGNHSYEASKIDTDYSFKLLSPVGAMVLHDANMPGVARTIKEMGKEVYFDSFVQNTIGLHSWSGNGIPIIFKDYEKWKEVCGKTD